MVALLAFATPAWDFFFVGRGFHVSTAAYPLLAFLALRRARFGWGWALAVLLLTAGMLGDLLMVAYGVIPLLLAGLVATWRERKLLARMVELTGRGGERRARPRRAPCFRFDRDLHDGPADVLLASARW